MPKHGSSRKQQSRHDEGGESQWSEWVWSEENRRYYSYRTTRSGKYEYQWHDAATESQDAATPRQQADIPVDNITQGMGDLDVSGHADSGYAESNYADSSYGYAYGSQDGNSSEATHTKSKSRSSRSKGKAVDYDNPQDGGEPEPEPEEAPPLDPFYGAQTDTQDPAAYEVEMPTQNPELLPSDARQSGDYHGSNPYGSNQPDEYDYETSNNATNATSAYRAEEIPAQDYAESSNDNAYAPYPSHSEGDAGSVTPTVTDDGQPLHISGTAGDHEQLDPRYKIERSTRFEPGMIFKILWSEPYGSNSPGAAPTVSEIRGPYGEPFYIGIRRFIVVANDEGHCTCVPILTYGGRGCNKWGIKPLKHGIIYGGHKAHTAKDEPTLGFKEVKAKLFEGEKLQRESRINYAKLVTVEHNVKVFFIGRIVKENMRTFKDAVDTCWVQKKHGQVHWNY